MNDNDDLGGMRVVTYAIAAVCTALIGTVFFIITNTEVEAVLEPAPVPTVTVTATPKPVVIVKTLPPRVVTKTIRITERASRSATRGGSKNATLACIRFHESTNNYKAVSKSGTYRGAYQMSVQYSDDWARRAGYESWAEKPADKWPPAVQDAVAADMGRSGWGHWSRWTSYNCPGF
jgi:hypothetical protein